MTIQYHELKGFTPAERETLQLRQSVELLHAIDRSNDTILVQVLVAFDNGRHEALVVDIECDEVPNRNPVGLRSPERVAIIIETGREKPPTVLALRKDFPNVMHLNVTQAGEPRSLCLYFEPHRSVMRSWTAPKFLQRIHWWLVATAEGTLHAADQPLELPFFDTGWELVVPEDFDERRKRTELGFVVSLVEPAHLRGSHTMLLKTVAAGAALPEGIGLAIIDCPPMAQGGRADVPLTMGALADALARNDIDLAKLLRNSLLQQIAEDGESLKGAGSRFVILMSIPLTREPGGPVERTQRLALLTAAGRLNLGLLLGAYVKVDNKVYRHVVVGGQVHDEGDWRSLQTLPAAILQAPSPNAFRGYSAIPTDGPKSAVLVGAGALGSELLNLWTRAGWGTWTIVDSDHIKPHNLARHTAFEPQIGMPKAYACKSLADGVYGKPVIDHAIVADACDQANDALNEALNKATLIVDCSTTLDFPRLASTGDHTARHVSVFLTPSGNDSVLLVEDIARQQRLRTLEAQYYRAVLDNDWGSDHLQGHLGTFWSGASCRDVSFMLPHSRVVAHAATLAEQIMSRLERPQASIQVWSRQPATGAVDAIEVPVEAEMSWKRGELTVYMDEGLERKLRQMRATSLPVESGGILLGFYDLNLGEAVIVDALPPPPDSRQHQGYFERGVEGLVDAYVNIQKRTGNVVSYLGEWHSHPRGHGARQSSDDLLQLFKLAVGMANDGLPAMQLIVGEGETELYVGEVVA